MKPELNCEYPEDAEERLFAEMVDIVRARMAHRPQGEGATIPRAQHAKATGCVRASFTVRDKLPEYFRYGVFQQPGNTFQAIVRFSNALETIDPDGKGTARGMAIKLLDVEGTPAIAASRERCQDFLMVNHPAFPFATPAEYVKFFEDRAKWGDVWALGREALSHARHVQMILEMRAKKVASPLEVTYWSGSPFRFGPTGTNSGRAVKYSVVPTFTGTKMPDHPDAESNSNYLRTALEERLKVEEAVFDFRVQFQTDAVEMPIEDVSVTWDEAVSPPVSVATLTIGVQDINSSFGVAFAEQCEKMSFSPWNALEEHRPMGGINRMRKAVYVASVAKRGGH